MRNWTRLGWWKKLWKSYPDTFESIQAEHRFEQIAKAAEEPESPSVVLFQVDPDAQQQISVLQTRIKSLEEENQTLLEELGKLQQQRMEIHRLYRQVFDDEVLSTLRNSVEKKLASLGKI